MTTTTERVTRDGWGARLATGALNLINTRPKGCTIHWEGPKMGSFDHRLCAGKVKGIQRFHQAIRGWSDIAYNEVVCPHGVRFEARGYGVGSAANGTTQANREWYAICVMVGKGDPVEAVVLLAVANAVADYQKFGKAGDAVNAHRNHIATECPGDFLAGEVAKGTFNRGRPSQQAPTHSAPRPLPPASRAKPRPPVVRKPAPGPHYPFPLPGGFYFGEDDGTNSSVSGRYRRFFRGHPDSWWLQQFGAQLARRGWDVGYGKKYLGRWGNDGKFGDEYGDLVEAFQRDQGLHPDRKIGPLTWRAAFENPVT